MEDSTDKDSGFFGNVLGFISLIIGKISGFWGSCDPETKEKVLDGAAELFKDVLKQFFKSDENSRDEHHDR